MQSRCRLLALSALLTGCYVSHERGDLAAGEGQDTSEALPPLIDDQRLPRRDERPRQPRQEPEEEEPEEPEEPMEIVECTVKPAPECASAFPRVMIVMDASSSMLAGSGPGANNWDKARLALAGNPDAPNPDDDGYVQPAFERELEIKGNTVTTGDVLHLGLMAFNQDNTQKLMLQYTPCAADNMRWAMDPFVSCDPPGCDDPYEGMPLWTFKNSDEDRQPPFVQTTMSYMPPCNPDGPERCVGAMFNTFTEEGLRFAQENIEVYRADPGGFELRDNTPFANILITDGATSPGSFPVPILSAMRRQGVPTYVIGLEQSGLGATGSNEGELDSYARAGGTDQAVLIEANEQDIADAFADAVERVIEDIGLDPCCQPNDCSSDPEPPAP